MAIAKKKRKFWNVEIPLLNKTTPLYSFTTEELVGRLIKYDLSRILRGKNATILLKVVKEGENLSSTPKEFKILPYFLKKVVRKGTNYVEDSFSTECEDAVLKIKPFLVTRRKVSRKVRKALRDKAREELIEYAKKTKTGDFFQEVLRNSLQKTLSLKLKKIYPLSICEIRILKVEKELDKKVSEEKIKKETPKEEKKEGPTKEKKVTKKPSKEEDKKMSEKKKDSKEQ